MSDRLASLLCSPMYLVDAQACELKRWADVQIPWHLKGLLLFNISVAMCVAPATHGNLTLLQRLELSLTGFLLQDLWALLASFREAKFKVKKGMYQLAPQTRVHLQSLALGVAVIASSTALETWNPWPRDQVLSEIHIERTFGKYRSQSQSGELSARAYWSASARVLRQQAARFAAAKADALAPPETMPIISPEEFKECSRRAWTSAMQLAAKCSNMETNALETMYRSDSTLETLAKADAQEAEADGLEDFEELCEDEEEMNEQSNASGGQLSTLLEAIQDVAAQTLESASKDEAAEPKIQPRDKDESLPDGQELSFLTNQTAQNGEKETSEFTNLTQKGFPKTLSGALSSGGSLWSKLWMLSVALRCGNSGMDAAFLRKAEVVRSRSRKLNWQQTLEHELKMMRLADGELMSGQRGSRLSKWISATEEERQKVGLEEPNKIKTGMVVVLCAASGRAPEPYLILTVWPRVQKPRPTAAEVPLPCIKVFRAVLLVPVPNQELPEDLQPTEFVGLFEPTQLLAVLDSEAEDLQNAKIKICSDSARALQVLETKVIQLPEKKPTRRRLRAKIGAFAKKEVSKENAAAKAKAKTSVAKKKKKEAVKPIEETVTANDIRRSGCGRSAVKKVMKRLLELDSLAFTEKPLFPSDGFCSLKGCQNLSLKAFEECSVKYFETKYLAARSPQVYGDRVFSELKLAMAQLISTPPRRVALSAMVTDIAKFFDKGSIQS